MRLGVEGNVVMGKNRTLTLAGIIALGLSQNAFAADFLPPSPPLDAPLQSQAAAPAGDFTGWYLRGDVGVGSLAMKNFVSQTDYPDPSYQLNQKNISDSSFASVGIGYQFNSWLRADLTGEMRTAAHYGLVQSYISTVSCSALAGYRCYDVYSPQVRSRFVLASAYADLGTWYNITPFVGAGAGYAQHEVSGYSDFNPQTLGYGLAATNTKSGLAWALMAGLSYNVTSNLKLEIGYRYLNLGTVQTGVMHDIAPSFDYLHEVQKFKLISQDIRIGMRWMLGDVINCSGFNCAAQQPAAQVAQAPIVRKY